ncbi:uncharacterized protein LOC143053652 [Mytilus galloprovincialis]|uniref:uncharacterized protein LOC143053652 n=1 Tax=Mytilus galloprovincialis TaxID=29158 RepID=UPI003F7C18FA
MARFTTTEFSLNTSDVSFEEDIIENFDYTVISPPPLFTADTSEKKGHTAERLVISDTARKTCETILSGFEMDTSEHILMNGDIAMDFYCYTDQSRKMKHDPNTNKIIWEDIRLPSAIRLHQVNGFGNGPST